MMDSPLTVAELSRLRKAIQQRDRLVAQGSATSGVDSRISSALSNLKLYLPTQTQLAAVLNDWETSDATKRSQITIWLQQNILDGTQSQESLPAPTTPPRPAFVHPPPPPALPSRTGSVISRPERPVSLSGTPPIPAGAQATPAQVPSNANNTYPTREIHTQASLKPPTPPPKDVFSGIAHESLMRRHTFAGRPRALHQSSTFGDGSTNDRYVDSPASNPLYPRTFTGHNPSQPNIASPNSTSATDSARRFGAQTSQPTPSSHGHTPNPPSHDSHQYHTPPSSGQSAPTSQFSSNFGQGYAQPQNSFTSGLQGGTSSYNQQFMEALAKIQAQQNQQTAQLIQQLTQAQQPSSSNSTAQILAAAQQQQAHQQANLLQQLQAQQAASANQTSQLLANLQQQQQSQTNQMLSMLQQYQQNAPNFGQNQNFQQNQQLIDMLSQMQSSGSTGVDWGSLASGTGMDPTTLMTMMMGGMDPTTLAMQGSGFMFG